MRILHSTTPHYTRCIKPNPDCKPLTFKKEEVNILLHLEITHNSLFVFVFSQQEIFINIFYVLLGYHAVGGLWDCGDHTH